MPMSVAEARCRAVRLDVRVQIEALKEHAPPTLVIRVDGLPCNLCVPAVLAAMGEALERALGVPGVRAVDAPAGSIH